MNRAQLIGLADTITAVRPDWQQAGVLIALQILNQTWPGTDAGLAAHATQVAAMPNAHTPQAFNATPPQAQPRTPTAANRDETCHICGGTRKQCEKLHEKESRYPTPDVRPHHFELKQEAIDNRVPMPQYVKDALASLMSKQNLNAELQRDDEERRELVELERLQAKYPQRATWPAHQPEQATP